MTADAGSVAGSAAVVVDAALAVDTAVGAAPADPGCDGWRVEKVEHMGMGESAVRVECASDKVKVSWKHQGARDGGETGTKFVKRAAWLKLWQQLEAAGWRSLDPACPTVTPAPESVGVTELELTIIGGKATKQIKCEGVNVTPAHAQIMKALDDIIE